MSPHHEKPGIVVNRDRRRPPERGAGSARRCRSPVPFENAIAGNFPFPGPESEQHRVRVIGADKCRTAAESLEPDHGVVAERAFFRSVHDSESLRYAFLRFSVPAPNAGRDPPAAGGCRNMQPADHRAEAGRAGSDLRTSPGLPWPSGSSLRCGHCTASTVSARSARGRSPPSPA